MISPLPRLFRISAFQLFSLSDFCAGSAGKLPPLAVCRNLQQDLARCLVRPGSCWSRGKAMRRRRESRTRSGPHDAGTAAWMTAARSAERLRRILRGEKLKSGNTGNGRWDHGTTGPRDYGTTGPRDYGTTGPRDYGTTGLRDHGTTGPRDYGTTGLRDYGTTGPRDYGTADIDRSPSSVLGLQVRSRSAAVLMSCGAHFSFRDFRFFRVL
jgi:hypothetical protein